MQNFSLFVTKGNSKLNILTALLFITVEEDAVQYQLWTQKLSPIWALAMALQRKRGAQGPKTVCAVVIWRHI